jgi:CheY-like chemotaxis protein
MTFPDLASEANATPRRRVLLVDDNLESVRSMTLALKDMGHDARFASNGFAALEMALSFRPHVVLLDIRLPEFGGDDIARQLKWQPGSEGVRIVAIASEGGDAIRLRASHAGCEELHVKPIDAAVLQAVVAR